MAHELVQYIRKRIKYEDKDFFGVFVGEKGSGKSSSALRLAEVIDPNFKAENVVGSAKEFMNVFNSKKLKRGSAIIWDEAGVGIPKRDWYELSNKLISYVLQVSRKKHYLILFTTPSLSYIDSNVVKLFNMYVEMIGIDRKRKLAIGKVKMIQHNPELNRNYIKYLVVRRNGRVKKIKRISFKKPSPELWRAYSIKRKQFSEKLFKDVEQTIDQIEYKKTAPSKAEERARILNEILKSPDKYLNRVGRINTWLIMADYKVSEPIAKQIKFLADRYLSKQKRDM